MSNPELKPCPFCGGKAELHTIAGDYTMIICDKCRAAVSFGAHRKRAETAERWNRREPDAE